MDETFYIISAYTISGALVFGLCFSTLWRAHHLKKRLNERERHEA